MTEMRISSFGSQEDGYVELDEPLVREDSGGSKIRKPVISSSAGLGITAM